MASASQARNLKGLLKTDKLDPTPAGPADRVGDAAAQLASAPCRDPAGAGFHPGPGPTWSTSGTGVLQRLEKLLEDAMAKITSVVSDGMKAKSAVAMVAALVAGKRDPRAIADLAKGLVCAASGTPPPPRRWTTCSIPITG